MRTYERGDRLPMIQLSKANLTQLVRLCAVPEQDFATISTNVADGEIRDSTLDGFLAHEELPAVLDNLHLTCSNRDRATISIDLGGFNSFSVAGEDDVWVRGNYDRLREFLLGHRRPETPNILRSTMIASLFIGVMAGLVVLSFQKAGVVYGFIASIASTYLAMRYISWTMMSSVMQPARIVLTAKPSFWRALLTRDNFNVALAVLALIFTILQTFLQVFW